tara:strand:+ start:62 stop:457 length:396 start_codon:yes stop_codon:yes gene_type:complete
MSKSLFCIRNAHSLNKVITTKGFKQIYDLNTQWEQKKDIELVITDLDQVSYNTSLSVFHDTPSIILDKACLKKSNTFYDFLKNRDECIIAYVGNNENVNKIKSSDPNYSKKKLSHCYPYLLELVFHDSCNN